MPFTPGLFLFGKPLQGDALKRVGSCFPLLYLGHLSVLDWIDALRDECLCLISFAPSSLEIRNRVAAQRHSFPLSMDGIVKPPQFRTICPDKQVHVLAIGEPVLFRLGLGVLYSAFCECHLQYL